jgi:hypothetical protein
MQSYHSSLYLKNTLYGWFAPMDFLKSHPAFLPTLLLLSEHIAELLIGSLFSEDAPDA